VIEMTNDSHCGLKNKSVDNPLPTSTGPALDITTLNIKVSGSPAAAVFRKQTG